MTPRQLYLSLYRAGVTYWQTPEGKIGYRTPNGLTPELRTAMRAQKDDLLFMTSHGMTVYGRDQEPAEWGLPTC